MKRQFSQIQITSGWKNIYDFLQNDLSAEETNDIFRLADTLSIRFETLFRDIHGIEKMHVTSAYTAAALYIPLKMKLGESKALNLMDEGAKKESLKKRMMLEKIPGPLFLHLCHTMTRIFFGNNAGFHTSVITDNRKELRFDILACPYCSTLKTIGCSELCPVICKQDEYSYKGMKNCIFERTETLGNGDEKCDFLYRLP